MEADETLVVRYIVEAEKAIEDTIKLREMTKDAVEQMRKLAAEIGGPLKSIAEGMKSAAAESPKFLDPNELALYKKAVSDALKQAIAERVATEKQARAEQVTGLKEREAGIKQNVLLQQAAAKQEAADVKQAIKEKIAAENEYIQVTKQGYGAMSQQAQQYGQVIQATKAQIQSIAQETGVSFQQAGEQLVAVGTPIKNVNVALQQLTQTASGMPPIFQRIGTAIQIAFGLGISQMVGNFIRSMREAARAGEEYLTTIFRLSASVKALQGKGMNVTFADSVKLAGKLREQFGVFSKRESLDAVASVQLLTRNFKFNEEQISKTSEINLSDLSQNLHFPIFNRFASFFLVIERFVQISDC